MAAQKFLGWVETVGKKWLTAITTSAGAGDAYKIPCVGADGKLHSSLLPSLDADTTVAPASENLSAGDRVNLWWDTETLRVRRADASNGRKADGYVAGAVTSGDSATVLHDGTQSGLSGLTPGAEYYLSSSTPGGIVVVGSVTLTSGHLIQYVGKAKSPTELLFEPDTNPSPVA